MISSALFKFYFETSFREDSQCAHYSLLIVSTYTVKCRKVNPTVYFVTMKMKQMDSGSLSNDISFERMHGRSQISKAFTKIVFQLSPFDDVVLRLGLVMNKEKLFEVSHFFT